MFCSFIFLKLCGFCSGHCCSRLHVLVVTVTCPAGSVICFSGTLYRPRKGGITVVPRRAVGMCSPSAALTAPVVSPRTRPSRSLSSGTSWRQQPWETSQRPVSSMVSEFASTFTVVWSRWPVLIHAFSPLYSPNSLWSTQALCEAALLCQLCDPQ